MNVIFITDFRLSWWLIIDVKCILGLLHHGDMGNVANVSEVHAAPPGSKCVGW
jgi:hypothetical protein